MNELKPAGYLSTDCIGEKFLCFSRPNDNDKCEELYAIPDTHRVVSVRLLRDLLAEMYQADSPDVCEKLRAIIDNKEAK